MAGVVERDLRFTGADFRRIRDLVYQHGGISLSDAKADMAYARLAKRVRAHGMQAFAQYLDWLESSGGADEWQHFTNALTTNLTSFFREEHHFQMLAAALAAAPRDRLFRVWCAASSTGEEPYSIVMTLLDKGQGRSGGFEVLASDIDTNVLQTAAQGIYALERIERLPSAMLQRHFLRGKGAQAGKVRVKPSVRDRLTFFQFNLNGTAWPEMGPFDVVFCRNVMIYFDKPTQNRILEQIARQMRPDGWLFLGHSENIQQQCSLFRSEGRTAYRLARENLDG